LGFNILPQKDISTSLSDATLWQAGVPIEIVTPADKSVNMMAASWRF